jgi:hypothetical protein
MFHCSDKDADGIDIAIGPCVPRIGPRGGRLRALVSPHLQHRVTTLDQVAGLYTVLTGGPAADAFDRVRSAGSGSLARLSVPFASRLADLGAIEVDAESTLAAQKAIADRWYRAVPWGPEMRAVDHIVLTFAGASFLARAKGHRTYCWVGPSVREYTIVSGVGQASYEAHRRAKR